MSEQARCVDTLDIVMGAEVGTYSTKHLNQVVMPMIGANLLMGGSRSKMNDELICSFNDTNLEKIVKQRVCIVIDHTIQNLLIYCQRN
jgi:hypothetical protein